MNRTSIEGMINVMFCCEIEALAVMVCQWGVVCTSRVELLHEKSDDHEPRA
jgi:hypothetical protein